MKSALKRSLMVGSVVLNIVSICLAMALYLPQYRAIPLYDDQLIKAIQEKSWNSAGSWWLIDRGERGILVEYRYHPLRFTRYILRDKEFALKINPRDQPVMLSFDGCDVVERKTGRCIKFRDLTLKDCDPIKGDEVVSL